jgi:hypothetical protein
MGLLDVKGALGDVDFWDVKGTSGDVDSLDIKESRA